jgi:hypothetical protein
MLRRFLQCPQPKPLSAHSPSTPYVSHALLISSPLTGSPEQYYAIFSTPLLPRPSQAQIFSSAHTWTPSTFVTTKFHTQTTGITVVLHILSSIFLDSKLEHKRFWPNGSKRSLSTTCSECSDDLLMSFPNKRTFSHLLGEILFCILFTGHEQETDIGWCLGEKQSRKRGPWKGT